MKKICILHYDVAQAWLERIAPSPTGYEDYLEEGESTPIGQTFEGNQLFIHKPDEDEYWLVIWEAEKLN